MKFFKHFSNKKILLPAIVGVFAIFLASTHITHAFDPFSLTDITGGVVSDLAFFASTLIAAVLGIVVAFEAWVIAVVLSINDGIFQSTFVQTGFSISLAIANLVFVLGIIVIAIATILRNDSYGIKKLLWKLVVAAILVNFGLVIAAPIFGLGNSLTHYFLNCIDPTGGGCTANSSGFSSYGTFATSFAGAFHPEDNFSTINNSAQKAVGTQQSAATGAFSALGTVFGKTFVPIFGIGLTVINLLLIIVVLAAFTVLLLIRYLYIAILAVLMPFAWASWIFPSFGSHWKNWWNNFIRWTFFSPIVLFFIYLAMLLMKGQAANGGMNFSQYQTGGIFGPLSSFLGSAFTPIITASLQEIIFAGLIVGGMIAANSMGIKMAGTATNYMKKGGVAVGNWSKKQGAKGARRGWQAAGGQKLTRNLQSGNLKLGKLDFAKIPGARRTASLAGRGLSEIQNNKALVDEAQKKVPKDRGDVLANLEGSMNRQDTLAHVAAAVKGGYLTEETIVNGKKGGARDIIDDKDTIQRYGQGDLVGDANKLFMSDTDIRNSNKAIKEFNEALAKGASEMDAKKLLAVTVSEKDGIKNKAGEVIHKQGDVVDARTLREDAMGSFVRSLGKADYAKANFKAVYGKKENADEIESQNVLLRHIATEFPAGMANVIGKLKSAELSNLNTQYPKAIEDLRETLSNQQRDITLNVKISPTEKAQKLKALGEQMDGLDKTEKKFNDLLANNSLFAAYEPGAGGNSSPAAEGGKPTTS